MAKEVPDGMAIVALNPGVINTDMLTSCFGTSAASYQPPDAWYVTLFSFYGKRNAIFFLYLFGSATDCLGNLLLISNHLCKSMN